MFRTLLALAAIASVAPAQQNAGPLPHPVLASAFPCGGRAGTAVEVACTGTDLDGAKSLHFSAPGFTAESIPPTTDATPLKPNTPPAPQRFRVRIADDVPSGLYDVRVVTPLGISNPRTFAVGRRPESVEREPNDDVPQANDIALESTVYGVVATPTDVDYYRFTGPTGQRILAHCQTASVDGRLDALVELYDAAGRRLARARRGVESDVLLDATLPADGEYHLRVCAYTHTRGDAASFYRLTLATGAWVDAAFPTVLEPGRPTPVTLYGRNLPGGKPDPAATLDGRPLDAVTVTITAPADLAARQRLTTSGPMPPRFATADGFEYRLPTHDGPANPILFALATAPVTLEGESSQMVQLPCEIAGRLGRKGERDTYRFAAKKGDVVVFELTGDRLGAANDFFLTVRDARGRDLAEFDDSPPNELLSQSHFVNRAGDPPPSRFTVPQDGEYTVLVGARDAATVFGVQSAYRLRLGPPRPDFRLVAVPNLDATPNTQQGPSPDALTLPRGGQQYLDVYIQRRDGFAAPITITAEGLPPGVTCPPQTIPPNARQAAVVLMAAADAPAWAGAFRLVGRATVGEQELVRDVRPGGVVWPAQRQTVPLARLERELVAAIGEAGPYRLDAPKTELSVRIGESVKLPLVLTRNAEKCRGEVKVYLLNVPANVISLNGATFAADQTEIEAELTPRSGIPPGVYQITLVGKCASFALEGRPRPLQVAPRFPAPPVTLTILPK